MGDRRPALCALALIIAPAFAANPATPTGAAERRYTLDARDGAPGAVHLEFPPDQPGVWTVGAVWTGRKLAGLWVENDRGETLVRAVGASPQAVSIAVDGLRVRTGDKLRVRFAPSVARGVLQGMLTIAPPSPPPSPAPVASKPAAAPLAGPGKVFEPVFRDPTAGRQIRTLAEALEGADAKGVEWTRRWSTRLAAAATVQDAGRVARGEFDKLWTDIVGEPAPAPALDKAFRGALAAVEDVVRQEQRGGAASGAVRQRREAIAAAFEQFGSSAP